MLCFYFIPSYYIIYVHNKWIIYTFSDTNKCIQWLSGTPKELTDEEKAQIEKARAEFDPLEAIKEDKTWNLVANIVAVFSVVVFTFFMGYFA